MNLLGPPPQARPPSPDRPGGPAPGGGGSVDEQKPRGSEIGVSQIGVPKNAWFPLGFPLETNVTYCAVCFRPVPFPSVATCLVGFYNKSQGDRACAEQASFPLLQLFWSVSTTNTRANQASAEQASMRDVWGDVCARSILLFHQNRFHGP